MLPAKPLTQQLFAESIEIHRDLDTGRLSRASHALRIPPTRHARQLLRALTSVSDLDTDARAGSWRPVRGRRDGRRCAGRDARGVTAMVFTCVEDQRVGVGEERHRRRGPQSAFLGRQEAIDASTLAREHHQPTVAGPRRRRSRRNDVRGPCAELRMGMRMRPARRGTDAECDALGAARLTRSVITDGAAAGRLRSGCRARPARAPRTAAARRR
jgi:hypothetical protein